MNDALIKDAVLRVGEVSGIEGRKVFIALDKNKNSSELLYDGDILKNISVGSYIELRKGFLSIIGKAEGEKLVEDTFSYKDKENQYQYIDNNKRTLTVTLSGYIGTDGRFIGGINDLFHYKIQIDHIVPVINRFKAKQKSIEHTLQFEKISGVT